MDHDPKWLISVIPEWLLSPVANNYIYDEQFDKISSRKNIELYEVYLDKVSNSIYSKRVNVPIMVLQQGKEAFKKLNIIEQSKVLLNIHQVFGRVSGGIDLLAIGGAKKTAATVNFSSTVSNWKKNYSDIRLVDISTSGLWEKKSENLLELL